jgi:Uma2 family endonuclease
MSLRTVLTYEDYAALPADGRRYELHEGEVFVTPAPSPRHQQVVRNMLVLLDAHVRQRRLGEVLTGPVDCILDASTIVQPDILYLEPARLTAMSERGVEGPPTLAIEVLSPSTRAADRRVKAQIYARFQVPYYWIADPESRTIEAYVLDGGQYRADARLAGAQAAALPPFADLTLSPDAVWP